MRIMRSMRLLLLAFFILAIPVVSSAGVFVSINIAPPALPVYVQPPCPVDGYLWTPGYWAYGDEGYFWVPAPGSNLRKSVSCGHPAIGDGARASMPGTAAIGVNISASTEESTTASVTAASGMKGDIGRAVASPTTAPSPT